MQDDHVEASLDRVRYAVIRIEFGNARLRHDRAIEATDVAVGIFPESKPLKHGARQMILAALLAQDIAAPHCFSSFRGVVEPYPQDKPIARGE
jgi:hypothetical protein